MEPNKRGPSSREPQKIAGLGPGAPANNSSRWRAQLLVLARCERALVTGTRGPFSLRSSIGLAQSFGMTWQLKGRRAAVWSHTSRIAIGCSCALWPESANQTLPLRMAVSKRCQPASFFTALGQRWLLRVFQHKLAANLTKVHPKVRNWLCLQHQFRVTPPN